MQRHAFALALVLIASTACRPDGSTAESGSTTASLNLGRLAAFEKVKTELVKEANDARSIKTVPVTVDDATEASVVAGIVPPKSPSGATPEALEGVFWMRGNPLPDYLLSFANFHWTTVAGSPYGFLATFAPGSFGWKEKAVAQGAAADDFTYVPEICRVPRDDRTLDRIAHLKATHDERRFGLPIADDLEETGDGVSDEDARTFADGVWNSGQLPLDGGEAVQQLAAKHFFYEAKFSTDYTKGSVTIFSLVPGPIAVQLEVPEELASFSLAPHPEDPDVYLRKSFIRGKSKVPNYYWLTRIVDGQGVPTPHFKEFLQCVQERSAGRILKVALKGQLDTP